MADGLIQVPPDSTGKKVDTTELTVGANTVERQRFTIAGASAADLAPVDATNGLAVDNKTLPPGAATQTTLAAIAAQSLDYDTGAGTAAQVVLGLALPANGGPVAGGTTSNPVRTDPTGTTTQPISAAALPLPTGAATAAKQPALGTAGSPASDVISVQGITSMTALKVDGSGVTQPVSGTVTANAGTNLNTSALALESGGNLATVAGAVDGTNHHVIAAGATDFLYSGSTALTPSFATIAASSSGANALVSAVTSKKIRVVALALMANGTVNVKFQSHTTPTDETGLFYLIANTGFVLPYNPLGWFQTVAGEQLDINLSGAIAVGGCLIYVAV